MTTREKVLVGVTVAALGVAAAYAIFSGDDDRPPVIVRGGGSLYFESGDEGSDRPRKPWKKKDNATDEYFQDYDKGKRAKWFQLYFVGGTRNGEANVPCPVVTVTEFTVEYDPDGDGQDPKSYVVNIRTNGRNTGPSVKGPDLTHTDGSPTVKTAGDSQDIFKVTVTDFACHKPKEVWVESIKHNP